MHTTEPHNTEPEPHGQATALILITALFGLLLLFCCGCRTVRDAQTIVRTDTVRIAARERIIYRTDTLRVTDRLYRNDTVWLRDSIRIKFWRDSVVHDTVTARSQDVRTVTETREVVKRSGYDRFCSVAFWIIVVIMLLVLAWRVILYIIQHRKPK